MKIAMFTDYFFPELGGIQDSVATTARALAARGHQVDIVAPRYGARDYARVGAAPGPERDLGAQVRITRRPSLPFPSSTQQSRAALPSPLAALRRGGGRVPDIIHVHSFFGIGLEGLLTGMRLGIPIIGTNHTTVAGFADYLPIDPRHARDYVLWFYNRCCCVTAPSRSVFEELGAARLTAPLRIVSNPIDIDRFRPLHCGLREVRRARFGLTGPTVTYAGRLGPEKNIDSLLHAVALLRDEGIAVELAIAGHGAHEAVLRTLAVSLRIEQQVKFIATLRQDELAQLLQISDVFALMSTSETQSMVLLQAMACGVPVVAARSRALPEFVGPGTGRLVDPGDPGSLASVLGALLAAPQLRADLGRGGRRLAERLGVHPVTDAWEALYGSVLQRRSAA